MQNQWTENYGRSILKRWRHGSRIDGQEMRVLRGPFRCKAIQRLFVLYS